MMSLQYIYNTYKRHWLSKLVRIKRKHIFNSCCYQGRMPFEESMTGNHIFNFILCILNIINCLSNRTFFKNLYSIFILVITYSIVTVKNAPSCIFVQNDLRVMLHWVIFAFIYPQSLIYFTTLILCRRSGRIIERTRFLYHLQ